MLYHHRSIVYKTDLDLPEIFNACLESRCVRTQPTHACIRVQFVFFGCKMIICLKKDTIVHFHVSCNKSNFYAFYNFICCIMSGFLFILFSAQFCILIFSVVCCTSVWSKSSSSSSSSTSTISPSTEASPKVKRQYLYARPQQFSPYVGDAASAFRRQADRNAQTINQVDQKDINGNYNYA